MNETRPHLDSFCIYQPALWGDHESLTYQISAPLISGRVIFRFEKTSESSAKLNADIQIKIPLKGQIQFLAETTFMSQPSREFSAFETFLEQDCSNGWKRQTSPKDNSFIVETLSKAGTSQNRDVDMGRTNADERVSMVINPLMVPIVFRNFSGDAEAFSSQILLLVSHRVHEVDVRMLTQSSSESGHSQIKGAFSAKSEGVVSSNESKQGTFVWDSKNRNLISVSSKLPWFGSCRLDLVST